MVGLGVAFLLFMAFLNVVKSGNLLNDSNLLYAALIFYSGAGTLYLGFGVTGTPSYVRFASLATWAGLLANTGAVAHRWYEAGHPPFASIYEMLLSFVWTLAVLTLIAEKKYRSEGHRHRNHAGGDRGRRADAVAADRSASAGAGAAIDLAARARHAGHAGLRGLCAELRAGHDVPDPGQDEDRDLSGRDQPVRHRDLSRRADPLRKMGRTQRGRLESGRKVRSISGQGRTPVRRDSRSRLADAAGAGGGRCAVRSLSRLAQDSE